MMNAHRLQWLLVTLAVAAVADLGIVFGQTSMCGALPQTAEVLRKFQKFEATYTDDYFIHAGGDRHVGQAAIISDLLGISAIWSHGNRDSSAPKLLAVWCC